MLSGTFIDAAHPTSGTVVLDGNTIKIESDFRSDNGPDLYIYLAQGTDGNGFVDLGRLKNVAGEQEYTVPDGVDYTKNKYVLVWCKQFSVLFGSAELK
ncbi:hypothetical protein NH26_17415 [Flammeovirga pacifica]|uniref:DM13 domain-containing protein n=2 Tax=Flammeovirga pacifica TaxID=915059 RepID=A0A1S1Z5R0_FLAPC|nr:hypothetical protein NH26_17415 [Flammeovirga pacifica]